MIRRTRNYTVDFNDAPHVWLKALGREFDLNQWPEDKIEVFHDSETVYVLGINPRLRYVGLDTYDRASGEGAGHIFIQNVDDFGEPWLVDGKQSLKKVRYLCGYF